LLLHETQKSIPRAYEKEELSKPLARRKHSQNLILEVFKYGKSYRDVIRRNRREAKERSISASVSPKIEKVLKDISKEQGQPDPF
jgi:hypothetical protein